MFEVIQQNEATAARRRLYGRLIDSNDAVSGKNITTTGVKALLSKNGVAFTSTADIVIPDTVNKPGEFYVELTQAEADTIGQYRGVVPKGTGYLDALLQASVVAYDPYADGASVTTIAAGVRTNLATELGDIVAIKAKTDALPLEPADESLIIAATDAIQTAIGTLPDGAAIADAIAARNYRGGSNTAPTFADVLASGLLDFTISGNTLTVKHSDGTTAFMRTLTRDQTLQIGAILSAA